MPYRYEMHGCTATGKQNPGMSVSVNKTMEADLQAADEEADEGVNEPDVSKILLVEEQAHVMRVIRHNLERCGFQVESAQNADCALRLMMSCRFDALILTGEQPSADIRALCMRGQDLLASTLTPGNEAWASPLMLVSCSHSDELALELGRDVPGFERLDHPVSLKRIVERLSETLGHRVNQDGGQAGGEIGSAKQH